MKYLIPVLFGLTLSVSTVHAAKGGACAKDRETHCAGITTGEGDMAKCMREKEALLSPECKAQREANKAAMKEVKEACHADVEALCSEVKPGGGRIVRCMKEQMKKDSSKISEACRTEMTDLKAAAKARRGK